MIEIIEIMDWQYDNNISYFYDSKCWHIAYYLKVSLSEDFANANFENIDDIIYQS